MILFICQCSVIHPSHTETAILSGEEATYQKLDFLFNWGF